jgi:hypothetical protein
VKTLRDEIAMAALPGLLGQHNKLGFPMHTQPGSIAREVYAIAEALLKEKHALECGR